MMIRDIINSFNRTIKEYDMIPDGSTVIAGVSGGADSVCLLLLLCEYRVNHRFNLVAAHFNHKLRGAEADGDEKFTRDLCETLKVTYVGGEGDVAAFASGHGMGTEEAARIMRYNFFSETAKKYPGDIKIAVAHNQNDRAETILHNIARGTSIEGLKGISPVRGNIIRPLLNITRAETEYICNEYGVLFRIDSTNSDCKYKRNRIRGNVIPYIEHQLGADFVKNMLRMSDLASEDNRYIKSMTEKAYGAMVRETQYKKRKSNKIEINVSPFEKEEKVIQARIVRMAISSIKGKDGKLLFPEGTGLGFVTTERVRKYILCRKTGGYIEIGKGAVCRFSYGKAVLSVENKKKDEISLSNKKNDTGIPDEELLSSLKDMCETAENSRETAQTQLMTDVNGNIYITEIEVIPAADFSKISGLFNDNTHVCFDSAAFFKYCEKNGTPVIRGRMSGDEFSAFGMKGTKRLNRLLIDCKVPVDKRDSVPVLASGNKILWVYNIRRSNIAPVQNESRNVIIITLKSFGSENLME
ncbi:MAG: tRNA lysidine(34) synthetase TilS [Clostridia bacterium]|nr:tRNA lysidine(34) synthetase TilS [Clostridia bacterium]